MTTKTPGRFSEEIRVNLALRGLTLAREYHSKRHISRIQHMYDRLLVTPLGKHPRLEELQDALRRQQTI